MRGRESKAQSLWAFFLLVFVLSVPFWIAGLAVWAAWHVVPFAQSRRGASWIVWQCLGMLPFRVLVVWVYNNTRRSVFAASMFHATANVSQFLFPTYGSHYDPFIAFIILTTAAAAVTLLFGPETLAAGDAGR